MLRIVFLLLVIAHDKIVTGSSIIDLDEDDNDEFQELNHVIAETLKMGKPINDVLYLDSSEKGRIGQGAHAIIWKGMIFLRLIIIFLGKFYRNLNNCQAHCMKKGEMISLRDALQLNFLIIKNLRWLNVRLFID